MRAVAERDCEQLADWWQSADGGHQYVAAAKVYDRLARHYYNQFQTRAMLVYCRKSVINFFHKCHVY